MSSDKDPNEISNELSPEVEEEMQILKNICILPPRQAYVSVPKEQLAKDAILLPPIFPSEPVSAIRGAIAEIRGYAHITNYRLVVEEIDDDLMEMILGEQEKSSKLHEISQRPASEVKETSVQSSNTNASGKKNKKKKAISVPVNDLVSPYTCDQKSVDVPASSLSDDTDEIILNDYELLQGLVESGDLHSNMGLRMVLERYDAGGLKDHFMKTRMLLDGNPPYVLSLHGPGEIAVESNDNNSKSNNQEKPEQDQKEEDSEAKKEDAELKDTVSD
jgi:protein TIF31